MALLSSDTLNYPTPEEVHSQLLVAARYAYLRVGIAVNVEEGSELWFRYRVLADQVSVAIGNGTVALRQVNPLEATGDDLVVWAAIFGVFKRSATSAIGNVIVETVQTGVDSNGDPVYQTGGIPAAHRITSPTGIEYEVTTTVVVTNGDVVEVQAVTTGEITNQITNTVMQWNDSSLPFLKPEAVVDAAGLIDGDDGDDEEDLRKALLARLRTPAGGGNPAQVQQTAFNASAAIDVAYTYPGVRGPASDDIVVMANTGDRTVSITTINKAAAAVVAEMPGSINYNTKTVNPEGVDVVIGIEVELPKSAGGGGGGFRDSLPWPSSNDTVIGGRITNATALQDFLFTVNSTSADPPKVGDRFGLWIPTVVNQDGTLGELREYSIKFVGGASGSYTITIDVNESDSLDGVTEDLYCSVGMENLATYAQTFAAAMYTLGPGQKTDSPDILPFGRRNPSPAINTPIGVSSRLLDPVTAGSGEIANIRYSATYAEGTTTTLTKPSLPIDTKSAPRILQLKGLGFRRQVQ